MIHKKAELPYQNLEDVNKDISKTFEDMQQMRVNLQEVLQHLKQEGMPIMVEEVSRTLKAVEKSLQIYQQNFPHLIPFE